MINLMETKGTTMREDPNGTKRRSLEEVLHEMLDDMNNNRATLGADYPYMKLIEILQILTDKGDK